MFTGSYGHQVKLAVDDALPIDASSKRHLLAPAGESLLGVTNHINTEGMTGTVSEMAERTREDQQVIAGDLNFHVSPVMLAWWLPKILGAAAVGNVYDLAETLPVLYAMVYRQLKVFTYNQLYVNKAIFRGRSGGFIDMIVTVLGVDRTPADPAGFPAIAVPTDLPLIFDEMVCTIDSTVRKVFDFELTIDNKLVARYANSTVATDIQRSDNRMIGLKFTSPFSADEYDLYDVAVDTGMDVQLYWAPSGTGYSTLFDMPCVQVPPRDPLAGSKGEIPLIIDGRARAKTVTGTLIRELQVTHDSTP